MDDNIGIPIIEVTEKNFESMFPAIKKSISQSFFIALDCELSGLGNRSKLNCGQVDIRYRNIVEIAQDYSIVSLGLSCFICQSLSSVSVEKEGNLHSVKSQNYVIQTFNILTLCSTPYIVEGASMKFLASHGFDFNKQYTQGIPYTKASKKTQINHSDNPVLRDIFSSILKYEKPLVLHNGFIDLMFLYDSFYTELPKKSEIFAADLKEMFPNGIFDTKYISEFHQTLPATFLEYIFKKLQLENESRSINGDWAVRLKFPPYPPSLVGLNWHPYNQIHLRGSRNDESSLLCDSYKYHGWCSKNVSCPNSHDINRIVRELSSVRQKRRKTVGAVDVSIAHLIHLKKQKLLSLVHDQENSCSEQRTSLVLDQVLDQENSCSKQRIRIRKRSSYNNSSLSENPEQMNGKEEEENLNPATDDDVPIVEQGQNSVNSTISSRSCSGHRAGFDAFMTGYILACILSTEPNILQANNSSTNVTFDSNNSKCLEELGQTPYANRIYLSGKEFPFLVSKSAYVNQSRNHRDIIDTFKS